MRIKKEPYGKLQNGEKVDLFTLKNDNGMLCKITNYGGIITNLMLPEKDGEIDVVLGKKSLEDYLASNSPYFGALTGRVAGRIIDAQFTLEGSDYYLDANDGKHCLHGGKNGWDKQLWNASIIRDSGIDKLQLTYLDKDGKNNFPGNVECTVTYGLTGDNSLEISYKATSDKDTPFNPTNHSYFNLSGENSGTILNNEVQIIADEIAEASGDMTLTGNKMPVIPDLNDLREPIRIGNLCELSHRNIDTHYFLKGGRTKNPRFVGKVYDPTSKRTLELHTTEPGVQFYGAMNLSKDADEIGKNGNIYPVYGAFCLETQDYPNSINQPLGTAILKANQTFRSKTLFKFK